MPQLVVASMSTAFRAGIHSLLGGDPDFHFCADIQGPGANASCGDGECIWIFSSNDAKWLTESFRELILAARGFLVVGDEDDIQSWIVLENRRQQGRGVLPVHATLDALRYGLHAIDQGLIVLSPTGAWRENLLMSGKQDKQEKASNDYEALSERELSVLQLLGQGLANKQIAQKLQLSENTVKFHISAIYSKLGVSNRTEALRKGVSLGLVAL